MVPVGACRRFRWCRHPHTPTRPHPHTRTPPHSHTPTQKKIPLRLRRKLFFHTWGTAPRSRRGNRLGRALAGAGAAVDALVGVDLVLVGTLADRLDILVRSAGNQVLFNAFERVGRQVLSLASAERKLFPDLVEEALGVARLFEEASPPALRAALVAYHQRRMDAAPLLILEREADLLRPTDGGRA